MPYPLTQALESAFKTPCNFFHLKTSQGERKELEVTAWNQTSFFEKCQALVLSEILGGQRREANNLTIALLRDGFSDYNAQAILFILASLFSNQEYSLKNSYQI